MAPNSRSRRALLPALALLGPCAAAATADAQEPPPAGAAPEVATTPPPAGRPTTLEDLERQIEELRRRDEQKQQELDELAHQLHDLLPPTPQEGRTSKPPPHVHGETHLPVIRLGANADILALYNSEPPTPPPGEDPSHSHARLLLREAELAAEARVIPWLYGTLFITRPDGEPFDIEEAYAVADLPLGLRVKAGRYRPELGLLNTVHEPERPQATMPLPIVEFFGEEQLREGAITIGRAFHLRGSQGIGITAGVWNNENEIAFNGGKTTDKAFAGKLYYGIETPRLVGQLGASAFTGTNASAGRTTAGVLDVGLYVMPDYNAGYDYPARFSLMQEVLWNRRETVAETGRSTNNAVGSWTVADFQFFRGHHVGAGIDYVQGLLDRRRSSRAYSSHYSWYFDGHSRLQLEGRYADAPTQTGRGWQVLLQWNVVLGPHSERPLLALVPSQQAW